MSLADARAKLAEARTRLQSAEAAAAQARSLADTVQPSSCKDVAAFRIAGTKAAKLVSDAESDVQFYADVAKQAEQALEPLEREAARASYAAAVTSRDAVAAKLPATVSDLALCIAPALETIRDLAAAQGQLAVCANALRKLGEQAAPDKNTDVANLVARIGQRASQSTTAEQLLAFVDLTKWLDAAPARAAERREFERARALDRERLLEERALRGEFGIEEQRKAEAAGRARREVFYSGGRGGLALGMPPPLPEERAYRIANDLNLKVEE
jgi:hypothetical protein